MGKVLEGIAGKSAPAPATPAPAPAPAAVRELTSPEKVVPARDSTMKALMEHHLSRMTEEDTPEQKDHLIQATQAFAKMNTKLEIEYKKATNGISMKLNGKPVGENDEEALKEAKAAYEKMLAKAPEKLKARIKRDLTSINNCLDEGVPKKRGRPSDPPGLKERNKEAEKEAKKMARGIAKARFEAEQEAAGGEA